MSGPVRLVESFAARAYLDARSWLGLAGGRLGPAVVAALSVLAAVLVSYGLVHLLARPTDELEEVLRPYRLLPEQAPRGQGAGQLTRPALAHVAALLVRIVESRGLRPVLESKLARAAVPLDVGEFLLVCSGAVVVLGGLGGLLAGVVGLLAGIALACAAPFGFLEVRAGRRHRLFEAQLPDVLKLVASSLRAGFSLLQSLNGVADQVEDPMRQELRLALSRSRLGEPLEDALGGVADATGSRDFAWTVMAIRIQREVGGNLAEVLDTVAATMTERARLRREVRTLTAEGRISALILAALPVLLGGFIFLANRPYLALLFTTVPGELALVGGLLLEGVGAWWMRRTIQIEV
ncbi:MAG TPA: type II secretion system F family protein [Acidimicrobiales bacterium]|nr:type II secretion system F family protein [Acidimicrobiales bacterium]